jgi:uncharacterized glyoxalase superfamily protein PhnB
VNFAGRQVERLTRHSAPGSVTKSNVAAPRRTAYAPAACLQAIMRRGKECALKRGRAHKLSCWSQSVTHMTVTTPLFVQNLFAPVAFYCDVLDFELQDIILAESSIASALIVLGDFHLFLYPDMQRLRNAFAINDGHRPGIRMLGKRKETMEEPVTKVRQRGVTLLPPVEQATHAARAFSIGDPDGYIVTFAELRRCDPDPVRGLIREQE